MARPREFDTDEVLDKAMQLFWHEGYERASLSELLKAMGIQRSSFYNSFGDKRHVFIRSLKQYMTRVNDDFIIKTLYESEHGLSGIEAVFKNYVESFARDKDCKGCLMVNTMVELAPHDEEIRELIAQEMGRVENAFHNALMRARTANLIPEHLNLADTAQFLMNTLTGMRVLGRQTYERDAFEAVAKTVLSILKR